MQQNVNAVGHVQLQTEIGKMAVPSFQVNVSAIEHILELCMQGWFLHAWRPITRGPLKGLRSTLSPLSFHDLA